MKKKGKKRVTKKKQTMSDFMRSWGLPDFMVKTGKTALRYQNPPEKGVYWYYFAKFIRERDLEMWGTCISCGQKIDSGDCGHYIPASECGPELLFDPQNNNLECSRCNAWDGSHLIGYRRNLDLRYGPGTANKLEERFLKYRQDRKAGILQKDYPREYFVTKLNELGVFQSFPHNPQAIHTNSGTINQLNQ